MQDPDADTQDSISVSELKTSFIKEKLNRENLNYLLTQLTRLQGQQTKSMVDEDKDGGTQGMSHRSGKCGMKCKDRQRLRNMA